MRAALLAAVMACGVSASARASVTYELISPVYNQGAVSAGATWFLAGLDLTVSEAAVARGSFTVNESGNVPGAGFLTDTGDLADFVSFILAGRGFVSPSTVVGAFSANLTFTADGSVSSGSIDYVGQNDEVHFTGSGSNFGGSFGSDQFNACGNGRCGLMGQLVTASAVPEPSSIATLGIGVLGLAMLHPKRRSAGITG